MFIIRLLRFINGYVRFRVSGVFVERFLNLAARGGINLWDGKKTATTYTGHVLVKHYFRLRPYAKKSGLHMQVEEKFGWPFLKKKYRRRVGLAFGILAFFVLIGVLGNFVWTIEVTGNSAVDKGQILDVLYEQGLKTGSYKGKLDAREIERKTMIEIDELSWIAVNITGSTVQVEVRERILAPDMFLDDDKACNIVARYTGQIQTIDVYDGQTQLKAGDTVLAGDLLVSGVIEDGKAQTRFVHARADIKARTEYKIEIEVPLQQVKRIFTGEEKTKTYLKILTQKVPLFFGKDSALYESDESIDAVAPFGISTPFAVIKEHRRYYTQETVTYGQVECKEMAMAQLEEEEKLQLKGAQVLNKDVSGKIEREKYVLTAIYTCVMEIGKEQEIFIER